MNLDRAGCCVGVHQLVGGRWSHRCAHVRRAQFIGSAQLHQFVGARRVVGARTSACPSRRSPSEPHQFVGSTSARTPASQVRRSFTSFLPSVSAVRANQLPAASRVRGSCISFSHRRPQRAHTSRCAQLAGFIKRDKINQVIISTSL